MIARKLILPVFSICLAQGTCIAMNMHIFPFIASYLLDLGVEPRQVSTYVGIIEGLQALTELVMIHAHVTALERLPHRALSIFTVLGPAIGALLFGLAGRPWQLIVLRTMTGIVGLGGLQAVILGEIVDADSSSQVFSWLTIAGSMGAMSGAGLSGYLAQPAGRVPLVGSLALFRARPYLLPGMTLFVLALIAAGCVFAWVPEKAADRRTNRLHKDQHDVDDDGERVKLSYKSLLASPVFRSAIYVNFTHKTCFFGAMALLSSAGKLPPDVGGIGLRISEIGRILMITPLLIALFLALILPRITQRYSTRTVVILASTGSVLVALYFPLANKAASADSKALLLVDVLWYASQMLGRIWWTMQMVILLQLYPNPAHRGRATVVFKQSTNLANALGAPTYGRIFGFSSQYPVDSFGRQIIWLWTGIVAGLTIFSSFSLPDISQPDPIVHTSGQSQDGERQELLPESHSDRHD